MCIVILSYPGCDVINLAIKLIFLIKSLLLHAQKVKILNILRKKRAFKIE